jgi:glutamyl-tRNA reductase
LPLSSARLLIVGLSHHTAPVEQREKASLSEPRARALVRDLLAGGAVREVVALSTCNRTEIVASAGDPAAAEGAVVDALVEHTSMGRAELDCARYVHRDDRAATHLLRVTASLDSMVLGESEIQAQVRAAWELAVEEGATGPLLNHLFRVALATGKRVRRETGIGSGRASVSGVAVTLAREAFADLPERRVLIIGAGAMAESTARALVAEGIEQVTVANRTVSSARDLAARFGGRGVGFDRVAAELEAADIVISSTDAPHVILGRADIARVMAARPGRPIVMVDIAVPRDLDAEIAGVHGVLLYDIDDLVRVVEATLNGRAAEALRAERIIAAEAEAFVAWRRGAAVTPTIASLRERAESIRLAELAKAESRWESLTPADRERLEALTQAMIGKLLHEPSVRLRAAAEAGDGLSHVESLRHLFALEPRTRAR